MARLTFCQIPEFSKDYKHVARFNSQQEQLAWMLNRAFIGIDSNVKIDAFTTTITVPVYETGGQTLSKMRECDYLYTQMASGNYLFFFIDLMEVVTSTAVKFHLTLDVWQTYHLSLTIMPSFVERCHVPRWSSTGIPSKEIVAEPLGNYESTVIKEENVPNNKGVYIITSTTPLGKVSNRPSGGSGGGDIPTPPTPPTGGCGNPSEGIPSPNGFLFIKGYEGLAQYAHNIGDGVMTIGYGCTDAYDGDNYVTLKANEPVSDELASTIMAQSLVSNYGLPLKNSLASDGLTVTSNEFDAILSFVYNAGLGSWNNSDIRSCLLNGDKEGAYTAWLTQNIMSGTQFEDGLRARRQAEANIFKSSQYELRTIVIYGQGGSVVGSLDASNSYVPALISNECQSSGTITSYDCIDGKGNKWLFPVGGRISSVYPNYPDGTYHGAIDIAGNKLKPIYPPEDGFTVYSSGWITGGYGNLCILYHAKTQTYHYFAHQNELPLVSVGQEVNHTDCIGYVGTTGNSTGYHLHWEIRDSDLSTKINPCANPSLSVGMTITRGQGGF